MAEKPAEETARLIGYVPSFQFSAGSEVPVHVHGDGRPTSVDLVRLSGAAGSCDVLGSVQHVGELKPQPITPGSWAGMNGRRLADTVEVRLDLQLTRWPSHSAGVIGAVGSEGGWSLEVTSERELRLRVRAGEDVADFVMDAGFLRGSWHRLRILVSSTASVLHVGESCVRTGLAGPPGEPNERLLWSLARVPWPRAEDETLDARVAHVEVSWGNPPGAAGQHRWDFASDPESATIRPLTPLTDPMTLHQAPTRAVTGPHWTGDVHHWRDAPDQWAAVHFHSDDLEDADWPVAATLPLAPELPTGVYGIRLRSEDGTDVVPFVVRSAGRSRSRIRVLLPTMTYLAYANEPVFEPHVPLHRGWWDTWAERFGLLSLYNWHADGSGVSLASVLRPLLNMRPDYRYWLTGAPHGLGLDLRLLRWLDEVGIEVDVLTDHELDADSGRALAGADVIVTGSHPEYWTRSMMTALESFLDRGGRLAYLGGNGFAAMVATHADRPHLLELRRRGNGPGLWDAGPGELGLALSGEAGGYWRHHRPTPRSLTGLDSSGMGFTQGVAYERTAESYDPACAFVFEGVNSPVFGHRSAVLGAAAGYEVDSADPLRGTPADTRLLASATGFGPGYVGLEQTGVVRADIVLRCLPGGGAVFGVGSIAWCGALGTDRNSDSDVGRITENVLRRFLNLEPIGDG